MKLASVVLPVLLAGCASLPSSGPTRHDIIHDRDDQQVMGFRIVDIASPAAVEQAAALPAAAPSLAQLQSVGTVDTLGPGDVLSVTIFEVGPGLFNGGNTSFNNENGVGNGGSVASASADNAGVLGVPVDREGAITLPYVGRIVVTGLTPAQVQARIQRNLKGMSQSPQALVSVRRNVSNTIVVLGVVARPGRQELTLAHDRLLDAIAEAGGTGEQPQEDMVVRFTRGGRSVEQLLSSIKSGSADDLLLLPGDRLQVIRRPQSFTVFGATSKVSQINFENPTLTLAEALARAGGPNDAQADPSAIFIFRYARDANGIPMVPTTQQGGQAIEPPTIYRLDMMRPASYFLAQNFAMRDKDVVYIANAAANRPAKLVNIINQFVSPAVTAKVLTQ